MDYTNKNEFVLLSINKNDLPKYSLGMTLPEEFVDYFCGYKTTNAHNIVFVLCI